MANVISYLGFKDPIGPGHAADAVRLEQFPYFARAVPNSLLDLIDGQPDPALPLSLTACSRLPFVVVSREQEMRQLFDKLCRIAHLQPNIYMEVVGVTTARAMVQAGVAASVLPRQFIAAEQIQSGLTLFPLDQNTYVRQPAIVTRRGQYISEYARSAIQLLQAGAPDTP